MDDGQLEEALRPYVYQEGSLRVANMGLEMANGKAYLLTLDDIKQLIERTRQ